MFKICCYIYFNQYHHLLHLYLYNQPSPWKDHQFRQIYIQICSRIQCKQSLWPLLCLFVGFLLFVCLSVGYFWDERNTKTCFRWSGSLWLFYIDSEYVDWHWWSIRNSCFAFVFRMTCLTVLISSLTVTINSFSFVSVWAGLCEPLSCLSPCFMWLEVCEPCLSVKIASVKLQLIYTPSWFMSNQS